MSQHKMQRSSHNKANRRYDRQKFRTEQNTLRKLKRHIDNNPNDVQSKMHAKSLKHKQELEE